MKNISKTNKRTTTKNDISDEWGKYNAGVALWHVKNRNRLSTEGVTKDTSILDYNLVVEYSDALLVFGVECWDRNIASAHLHPSNGFVPLCRDTLGMLLFINFLAKDVHQVQEIALK